MTRIDPTTPTGVAPGVADGESLDGVWSRGNDRVVRATALPEFA